MMAPDGSAPPDELPAKARVLFVDDSALARAAVLAALLRFDVVALKDGGEALERARAAAEEGKPFNLFILDIEMEPLDGFTLLSELRRIEAYGDTKTLFLSGTRREEHIRRVQEVGATLIEKRSRAQLREEIERAMRSIDQAARAAS